MKKICFVLTILVVMFQCSNIVLANSFDDTVGIGNSFSKAIDILQEKNIIEGFPDGTFRPNDHITRAEFAALLYRYTFNDNHSDDMSYYEFGDVDKTHWAYPYINTMFNEGIMYGIGNNLFAPETNLTFEQALMMILRTNDKKYMCFANSYNHPMGYLVDADNLGLMNGFDYYWADPRYTPWTSVDDKNNKVLSYENEQGEKAELPTLDELKPDFMETYITRKEVCLLLYNLMGK